MNDIHITKEKLTRSTFAVSCPADSEVSGQVHLQCEEKMKWMRGYS